MVQIIYCGTLKKEYLYPILLSFFYFSNTPKRNTQWKELYRKLYSGESKLDKFFFVENFMSEQFHVEERKSEHVDSSGNWGGGEEKRLKATGNSLSVLFVEKRKNVSAGVEHAG